MRSVRIPFWFRWRRKRFAMIAAATVGSVLGGWTISTGALS
jgi:hypothetical protein